MKKSITIGIFSAFLFLFAIPQVSAQNAHQKEMMATAKAQTAQLAKKMDLTDNQKAYVSRYLYDYQARVEYIGGKYSNYKSKAEVDTALMHELSSVLSAEQLQQFKKMKADLLKVKAQEQNAVKSAPKSLKQHN